jgi:AcrR family transcriptional regulator
MAKRPPPRFQRARKPEEKEVRRQAILAAARKLMREVGTVALSLSELARRSGVSKPNIYRYFESREEVLLQVWVEEVRELGARLARSLPGGRGDDIAATARAIVAGFAAQPRLCELTSLVSPLLERNLSTDAIVAAKRTLAGLTLEISRLLHARLPSLSLDDCAWAASTVGVYVAGLWPAAQPGPAAEAVHALPELAAMQPVFERDLLRFVEVLFAGLVRGARAKAAPGRAARRR